MTSYLVACILSICFDTTGRNVFLPGKRVPYCLTSLKNPRESHRTTRTKQSSNRPFPCESAKRYAKPDRAKNLMSSRTGESVSTSEIAKQFLESAREDRLEVVDLMSEPTKALREIRRKGEAQHLLWKAEWVVVAPFFVQQGLEHFRATHRVVAPGSLYRRPRCVLGSLRFAQGPVRLR